MGIRVDHTVATWTKGHRVFAVGIAAMLISQAAVASGEPRPPIDRTDLVERVRQVVEGVNLAPGHVVRPRAGVPQFTQAWLLAPGNFAAINPDDNNTREAIVDRNGCFVFTRNQANGVDSTVLLQSLGTIADIGSDLLMDPPNSGNVVPSWDGEVDGLVPTSQGQKQIAVDADGFVYIHTAVGAVPNRTGLLTKLTPDGGVIADVASGDLGPSDVANVFIGTDEIPILIRTDSVQARNPFTLGVQWSADVAADYPGVSSIGATGYAVDRAGNIFVKADTTEILKIAGQDGTIISRSEAASSVSSDSDSGLLIDSIDGVWSYHHDSFSSSPMTVRRWDGDLAGYAPLDLSISIGSDSPRVLDAVVTPTDDLLVLTTELDGSSSPILWRIGSDMSSVNSISQRFDTIAGALSNGADRGQLAVGSDGSVYVWMQGGGGINVSGVSAPRYERIRKYDPESFELQREIVVDHGTLFSEVFEYFYGFAVDGGDNVFTWFAGVGPGFQGDFRITKFIQPTADRPTIACDAREVSIADQSIWEPGLGRLEDEGDFFSFGDDFGFGDSGFYDVFILGEFGGGMAFNLGFDVCVGWKAEVEGGSVDAHMPFEVEWEIPPQNLMQAGSPVTIPSPAFGFDEGAARMTTCFTPTYNAGLTSGFSTDLLFGMQFRAFSRDVINETFWDDERDVAKDYIPYLNIEDLAGDSYIDASGEWYELSALDLPLAGITGRARTPTFNAQSMFADGAFDTGVQIEPTFEVNMNVTKAVSQFFFCADEITCPLNNVGKLSKGPFELDWDWRALQLLLQTQMGPTQGLRFDDLQVTVDYQFSHGVPTQAGKGIGEPLTFSMPVGGEVEITPTVQISGTFRNDTGFFVGPKIAWEIMRLDLAASFAGWGLWSPSFCFECSEVDLPGAPYDFDVYGTSFPVQFDPVALETFTVTSLTTDRPVLTGASRDRLPLIIYDQLDPTPARLLSSAEGQTRLLLHGDEFRKLVSGGTTAWVSHMGRTEELEVETVFNARTMCVLLPNRFRTVPGVAKVWVETANGCSRRMDIPIEFPKPQIATVNPNLWAADPDMLDLPIQVIDRKTPLGTDTFLTRRDYYVKMRDELWTNAMLADLTPAEFDAIDADSNGIVTAAEFFPSFDFNQMPQFPSVMFDGVPLPRFIQPTDSGVYNARITRSDYDEVGFVPVTLCNPGPGGGMSRTLHLNIAAPPPQIASVDPPMMEPGGEFFPGQTELEIIVTGPKHVEIDVGFEEPKFSNFNASSVVLFDGAPIPTEYLHSGALRAILPTIAVQHPKTVEISVYTPSNGSVYFEELYDDSNGDTIPDDLIYQGLADSGGTSIPVVFEVAWREPVLDLVVPSEAEQGSPAFRAPPSGAPFNVTVMGESFRDGAVVLFNGEPRETEFVSRTLVRARLLPTDLVVLGDHEISVLNPGAGQVPTIPAVFTVLPSRGYQINTVGE